MFVRKKTKRSGTVCVVVVSKSHGKFTEVKKFGVAKLEEEADEMFRKAQLWLHTHDGQQELDFDDRKGKEVEEELERLVSVNKIGMSVDKVLDAAKTITTIRVRLPENRTTFTKTLFLTEKHLAVKPLFNRTNSNS